MNLDTLLNILYLLILVAVAGAAYMFFELWKERREHRENALYIQNRVNGEIHHIHCQRATKIAPRKRIYLDEWDYRYLRDHSTSQLNHCKLCALNQIKNQ